MRLSFDVGIAVLCATGSLGLSWSVLTDANKDWLVAEVSEKTVTLEQQENKKMVFKLYNRSGRPIEITEVTQSCTCTNVEVESRKLMPGSSTDILATIRTTTLRGEFVSQIQVNYRVQGTEIFGTVFLKVRVTVKPHYVVEPDRLSITLANSPSDYGTFRANIVLISKMAPKVKIERAYSTHPAIQVTGVSEQADKNTILLKINPMLSLLSTFDAHVIIETNSTKQPSCRVPAHVVVVPPIAGILQGD